MIINKHVLLHAHDAGNGYHGTCLHCGLVLETDLGYCSWNNTKCIDRTADFWDLSPEIRGYARWHNLIWDKNNKIFARPYTNVEYTIDELNEMIEEIKLKYEIKE